ncbi:hypothetical protein M3Y98_00986100 [Aphelenchoides besseyi]|nr:hypothetical protein M3Y98_00986100 [Aphelenchoides besseyi]KAI6194858.1 hypothetical protein M3Y96_01169800 [Aphelenchoides besseyi]
MSVRTAASAAATWTGRTVLLGILGFILSCVSVVILIVALIYLRRYRKHLKKTREANLQFEMNTYDTMLRTYQDVCEQKRLDTVQRQQFCQCQQPLKSKIKSKSSKRPCSTHSANQSTASTVNSQIAPSLSSTQSYTKLKSDRTQSSSKL